MVGVFVLGGYWSDLHWGRYLRNPRMKYQQRWKMIQIHNPTNIFIPVTNLISNRKSITCKPKSNTEYQLLSKAPDDQQAACQLQNYCVLVLCCPLQVDRMNDRLLSSPDQCWHRINQKSGQTLFSSLYKQLIFVQKHWSFDNMSVINIKFLRVDNWADLACWCRLRCGWKLWKKIVNWP